jgi:deferrochelatase/peroxidase EfeB
MTAPADLPATTATPVTPPPAIPSGIVNRPPDHLMIAAFAFAGDGQSGTNVATMEGLRQLVERELRSALQDTSPATDKTKPAPETGELGFEDGYNRAFLTITFGLSSSGFSALGVTGANLPGDLVSIPWDKLGDTPQVPDSGDVVLQICSDDPVINEHVVRRVTTELASRLSLRYVFDRRAATHQPSWTRQPNRRTRPNRLPRRRIEPRPTQFR